MSVTLKEVNSSGHNSTKYVPFDHGGGGTVTGLSQTFTAESSYELGSVRLRLLRVGSPGDVTLAVYATTAGLPTGGILGSVTIDGNGLSTSSNGSYRFYYFDPKISITDTVMYAIVITAPNGDGANYVGWRIDTSGTYGNGVALYYNYAGSSAWTDGGQPNADFMFGNYETLFADPATTPNPVDDEIGVAVDLAQLTWIAGANTDAYDVYFGTIGNMSYVAYQTVGNEFYNMPSDLDPEQEYEWRVDSYNSSQLTIGTTWSFTTSTAGNDPVDTPIPSDSATGQQSGSVNLSWADPNDPDFDDYEVYFGPTGSMVLVETGYGSLSLTISNDMILGQEYSWRIDGNDGENVVTGSVWTFTIESFDPPTVTNLRNKRYLIVISNNEVWYENL